MGPEGHGQKRICSGCCGDGADRKDLDSLDTSSRSPEELAAKYPVLAKLLNQGLYHGESIKFTQFKTHALTLGASFPTTLKELRNLFTSMKGAPDEQKVQSCSNQDKKIDMY